MEPTEFYRDKDNVIYSTTVNGKDYYFYDGFKEAIDTLTQKVKRLNNLFLMVFGLK